MNDLGKKGFPLWAKLLVAFGALGVMGFVGLVAIGVWAYTKRDDLAKEGKATFERAERYAKSHSQAQCLDESFREMEKCSGFKCDLYASIFLQRCMDLASPSPELCAQTPDPQSVIDTTRWTMSECPRRGHGRFQNQSCSVLLQTAARACRSPRSHQD